MWNRVFRDSSSTSPEILRFLWHLKDGFHDQKSP